jgi:hypothetical protein
MIIVCCEILTIVNINYSREFLIPIYTVLFCTTTAAVCVWVRCLWHLKNIFTAAVC